MGHAKLKDLLRALARDARNSLRDLTPIIVVISVFQGFIIRQPVDGLMSIVVGGLLVFAGLTFSSSACDLRSFLLAKALLTRSREKGAYFGLSPSPSCLASERRWQSRR